MTVSLIPSRLLQESDKILFVAHLAIGDYTYLQNCFRAFAAAYPHLDIHLWVDETRRTSDASKWPHLASYALYDWLEASGLFAKIYRRTYSPTLYEDAIAEAQGEAYPIVVSLANLRPHRYALLARALSPHGFVAALRKPFNLFRPSRGLIYRKLDATISLHLPDQAPQHHISDVYAWWFEQAFGLHIPPAARLPFVHIPDTARADIRQRLAEWGFAQRSGKLVFINPFAKTEKRCWPLENVAMLIRALRRQDAWRDTCFVVNAMPQDLVNARQVLGRYELGRTEFFTAETSFFQLPAMLAECDLIVSAETAVMHLANTVKVPVVALMRRNNPQWVPLDATLSTVITTARRRGWVKEITVDQVMDAIDATPIAQRGAHGLAMEDQAARS